MTCGSRNPTFRSATRVVGQSIVGGAAEIVDVKEVSASSKARSTAGCRPRRWLHASMKRRPLKGAAAASPTGNSTIGTSGFADKEGYPGCLVGLGIWCEFAVYEKRTTELRTWICFSFRLTPKSK